MRVDHLVDRRRDALLVAHSLRLGRKELGKLARKNLSASLDPIRQLPQEARLLVGRGRHAYES